jgi:hypothetical protein
MSTTETTNTTEKKTFFEDIKDNASSAKKKYLGEDYPYSEKIKMPSQIGVRNTGTLPQLGRNFDGILAYSQLLISGGGPASATNGPMGNKFFLQTGSSCHAVDTNTDVDRYIYVNNIPSGSIPFISSGTQLNDFRGFIPGILQKFEIFNPLTLAGSLLDGVSPDCQPITLDVVDTHDHTTTETHYMTLTDIGNMNPCDFKDKTNPRTKKQCRSGFTNINNTDNTDNTNKTNTETWIPVISKDTNTQIYFASVGILGVYIAFKALQKLGLVPKDK